MKCQAKTNKIHNFIIFVSLLGGIILKDSFNPSSLRSKAEICNALLRLMEDHPYEEITVKQIALEAKLVRKTFYRNFDSKEDVLETILDKLIYEYRSQLIVSNKMMPLDVIFNFCTQHKDLLLLFDKNNMMYRIQQKLNDAILVKHEEFIALGLVSTEFFCGLDPKYQILFNIGGIWNVICHWTHDGMKDDSKQIIEKLSSYIIMMGEYAKKGTSPFQRVAK